jgi:hypothetical protein
MKKIQVLAAVAFFSVFLIALAPASSAAQTPTLTPPPATLPSITYYINGTSTYDSISNTQWQVLFQDVFNNHNFVKYNWSQNLTEDLIVFDLSYTGLNPYGNALIVSLSNIGSPTVQNLSKAFNATKNDLSLVKSGGNAITNIQALNGGAYPGFSWSKITVKSLSAEYRDAGIIVALIAVTFVLYFYFNRKK